MEFKLSAPPVSVDAHPDRYVAAVGLLDGNVMMMEYGSGDRYHEHELYDQPDVVWTKRFKREVRAVRFSDNGASVFSLTKNRALCQRDTESGRKMRCVRVAHRKAPTALLVIDENLLASGDEDGECHLWDWRLKEPRVYRFNDCVDYVSDIDCDLAGHTLLWTSGDGTLTVADLRKRAVVGQSYECRADLESVAIVYGGKRVICGGFNGYLEAFAWNEWDEPVDRIVTGHKAPINCIAVVQENLVLTASLDDTVRVTHLYPNRMIAVVASHESGVNDVALSVDQKYVLSVGLDESLKVTPFNAEQYAEMNKGIARNGAVAMPTSSRELESRRFFSGLAGGN